MRVLFLTQATELGPSSRYRVYQLLPLLRQLGIEGEVSPAIDSALYTRIYLEGRGSRRAALLAAWKQRRIDLERAVEDVEGEQVGATPGDGERQRFFAGSGELHLRDGRSVPVPHGQDCAVAARLRPNDRGRPEGLNGGIVLMHLASHRKTDRPHEGLPQLLRTLQSQGYRIVTVSELLDHLPGDQRSATPAATPLPAPDGRSPAQ